MLACVSPDAADAPETLCTLQVAPPQPQTPRSQPPPLPPGPHRSALAVVA